MKESNKTIKIVIWTAIVTALVIVAPIIAFVQGMNYEKRTTAEVQVKAAALVKAAAPAPAPASVPKQ